MVWQRKQTTKGRNNKIYPPHTPPPTAPLLISHPLPNTQFPVDHRLQLFSPFLCVSNQWFPLLPFIFYFVSYIFWGGVVVLVMFSLTVFLSLDFSVFFPLPPFFSFALSSYPLHSSSWSVRGVTGMSQLSPSLSTC